MPAAFSIDLVPLDQLGGKPRKLLNTEKLVFATPSDVVSFCESTLVSVTANAEAVPWDHTMEDGPVLFNLSVGQNIVGVPLECFPHAIWIAASMTLMAYLFSKLVLPLWPWSLIFTPSNLHTKERHI